MTDRELLELAAKAAGYPISEGYYEESKNGVWWIYIDGIGEPPSDSSWTEIWNPLTCDGDALRLAVKLGIDPMFNVFDSENNRCVSCIYPVPGDYLSVTERYGNDQYAATRRAIVRASAAIGEQICRM